jgi:hypothetical protein
VRSTRTARSSSRCFTAVHHVPQLRFGLLLPTARCWRYTQLREREASGHRRGYHLLQARMCARAPHSLCRVLVRGRVTLGGVCVCVFGGVTPHVAHAAVSLSGGGGDAPFVSMCVPRTL